MARVMMSRFEARVQVDVHSLLKRAAEIEGRSLSDFVINNALIAAKKIIEQQDILQLSAADQQLFANALLNPPPPNAAMKKAIALHRKLIENE
ncbi:hypothetical protein A1D29_10265 [Pasteurellaceae bacterium Orientalotternb1]|nr:hypothetical protein A1D29_10265 [Pasteurellaceae bacterium Orientalotternb1]